MTTSKNEEETLDEHNEDYFLNFFIRESGEYGIVITFFGEILIFPFLDKSISRTFKRF